MWRCTDKWPTSLARNLFWQIGNFQNNLWIFPTGKIVYISLQCHKACATTKVYSAKFHNLSYLPKYVPAKISGHMLYNSIDETLVPWVQQSSGQPSLLSHVSCYSPWLVNRLKWACTRTHQYRTPSLLHPLSPLSVCAYMNTHSYTILWFTLLDYSL